MFIKVKTVYPIFSFTYLVEIMSKLNDKCLSSFLLDRLISKIKKQPKNNKNHRRSKEGSTDIKLK